MQFYLHYATKRHTKYTVTNWLVVWIFRMIKKLGYSNTFPNSLEAFENSYFIGRVSNMNSSFNQNNSNHLAAIWMIQSLPTNMENPGKISGWSFQTY